MRAIVGLPLLAALTALTWVAAQRGAADLIAFGPRHALELADSARTVPDGARRQLERALELDGGNAQHHDYLARWHWGKGQHREALDHYRASTRLRPGWPYAWAGIAITKQRLGEIDKEFDTAVGNAARLGSWEPPVQLALAEVAMKSALPLSPEARRAALGAMSNALKRQEAELVRLAVRHGRLDLLCAVPGIGAYSAGLRCI
jgi:hypothetical protein